MTFTKTKLALCAALSGTMFLAGCAADGTAVSPGQRTAIGAVGGAIAGAIIGNQTDAPNGGTKGALIGATLGAGVGYALDRQAAKMQAIADANPQYGIGVSRTADGGVKVNIPSDVTYASNSDQLSGNFSGVVAQIAQVINSEPSTLVQVVGHADSDGSDSYNQDLSQRRARNFGFALVNNGVAQSRIYTIGRGESQPIASNATAEGKRQNRRVEVFLRAPQ